jgi:hypothetical protein
MSGWASRVFLELESQKDVSRTSAAQGKYVKGQEYPSQTLVSWGLSFSSLHPLLTNFIRTFLNRARVRYHPNDQKSTSLGEKTESLG